MTQTALIQRHGVENRIRWSRADQDAASFQRNGFDILWAAVISDNCGDEDCRCWDWDWASDLYHATDFTVGSREEVIVWLTQNFTVGEPHNFDLWHLEADTWKRTAKQRDFHARLREAALI
jgi:hypothetical protein